MKLALGIPLKLSGSSLPRRLLWLNAVRLLILLLLLSLTAYSFLGGRFELGTESARIALWALGGSFAVTGTSTALLRRGWRVEWVTHAQLVFDQLVWTALVYLSGGVQSAATPFYGLSCLAGAVATGIRGAVVAAVAAVVAYGSLAVGLYNGFLKGPADQTPEIYRLDFEEMVYPVGANLLGIVVVMLLAGYLAERLRWTGGELVEARERAERAERLAALGRLATGLAHEIRNPLGAIAGSIQILSLNTQLSEEDRQLCRIVERETARLNDLVTDMMDLAKPRQPRPVPIDVVALVRDVVTLSSNSGRGVSDVMVRYHGPTEPRIILADAALFRQLVWNLVRNAVQASSAEDRVEVHLDQDGTGQLRLSVEDQGPGIQPEMVPRIFDAFFTTRSHGTGVGLAVVKRVADEHGFGLFVDSTRERGARFVVLLGAPQADPESDLCTSGTGV